MTLIIGKQSGKIKVGNLRIQVFVQVEHNIWSFDVSILSVTGHFHGGDEDLEQCQDIYSIVLPNACHVRLFPLLTSNTSANSNA